MDDVAYFRSILVNNKPMKMPTSTNSPLYNSRNSNSILDKLDK